mmetsp:Transcript_38332/g.104383  ORF Transcript_38332/g.104383 Transcript_38332/m.104383 type:complete len:202 (-) Transcript_38332:97-702(-)
MVSTAFILSMPPPSRIASQPTSSFDIFSSTRTPLPAKVVSLAVVVTFITFVTTGAVVTIGRILPWLVMAFRSSMAFSFISMSTLPASSESSTASTPPALAMAAAAVPLTASLARQLRHVMSTTSLPGCSLSTSTTHSQAPRRLASSIFSRQVTIGGVMFLVRVSIEYTASWRNFLCSLTASTRAGTPESALPCTLRRSLFW